MNIGMLWFDNDVKKSLVDRVNGAAKYYEDKYGAPPDVCYVHPSMIKNAGEKIVVEGVVVETTKQVLPNHFWLGRRSTL